MWRLNASNNALIRYIDVVVKNGKRQQKTIDTGLINSIAARSIVVKHVDVDKDISYNDTKSNNRIDLIVTCNIIVNNEAKETDNN